MSTTTKIGLKPVDIRILDEVGVKTTVTVLAETTSTSGLVIAPQTHVSADGTSLTGFFTIIHEVSGLQVPTGGLLGLDTYTARRVATALGTVPIDWTADMDTVVAQHNVPEVKDAMMAALRDGKFPAQDTPEGADAIGPSDYPRRSDQVTARQMAAAYTRTALRAAADLHEISGYDRDDTRSRQLFVLHIGAMSAEYGIVHLLRAFHAAAPDDADAAARDLWEAYDAGDSLGEFLYDWGREYGIEGPDHGDATRVGVTMPPPLSYDAVLRAPLAYEDHGTVGTLRQSAGKTGALAEDVFGKLMASITGKTAPAREAQQTLLQLAHGCSFYGWSLVAVLGWLAKEYPYLAIHAANMIDDIGTNGGNDYCTDVPTTGAGLSTEVGELLAELTEPTTA